MPPERAARPLLAVAAVAALLFSSAGEVQAAVPRADLAGTSTLAAGQVVAKKKPAPSKRVRLKAARTRVAAGSRVRFAIATGTKSTRRVHIQRWSPARKKWGTVATRTVRRSASIKLAVPHGTSRFRAVATVPTGRARARQVGRSAVVSVHGFGDQALSSTPPGVTTPPPADAGSVALGEARYPVPEGAVFVSGSGSDANVGSVGSPLRTLGRAVSVAKAGSTIVLRAGEYHESVMMPGHKALTVQNYPGEAAWLEGSSVVSGWVRSGDVWVRSGWTASFDSSPTYTRGAPDGTAKGWQFVNPAFPMAAHPDQVFVDGVPLRQVASESAVGPGTFFVDEAGSRLVMGSDPSGRTVRASDLDIALTVTAPGTVIRGIGVARYATSVPQKGSLRVWAGGSRVENVVVKDNATQGVALMGAGITVSKVTSSDNGLNGFETSNTDDLVLDRVRAERNNRERFNDGPVAAGIKAHASRRVLIQDSVFSNNYANGIWFDVSNYDVTVRGNDIVANTADGLILELSEKLTVINNRIINNGIEGLFLLDAGRATIWNNTISGSPEPVRIHDTPREAADLKSAPYGYDPRQPKPDPTVTWKVYGIDFKNNLIGDMKSGWCGLVCVLNDVDSRTGNDMATFDGNVYQRTSTTNPPVLIRWSGGKGIRTSYSSLKSFRSANPSQEPRGAEQLTR